MRLAHVDVIMMQFNVEANSDESTSLLTAWETAVLKWARTPAGFDDLLVDVMGDKVCSLSLKKSRHSRHSSACHSSCCDKSVRSGGRGWALVVAASSAANTNCQSKSPLSVHQIRRVVAR